MRLQVLCHFVYSPQKFYWHNTFFQSRQFNGFKDSNWKKRFNKFQDYDKSDENDDSDSNDKSTNSNGILTKKQKEAYDILGVTSNSSDAEVKKAYRALAVKYHPDNAATLGDEAVRQATESMKQINEAWQLVKMARQMR